VESLLGSQALLTAVSLSVNIVRIYSREYSGLDSISHPLLSFIADISPSFFALLFLFTICLLSVPFHSILCCYLFSLLYKLKIIILLFISYYFHLSVLVCLSLLLLFIFSYNYLQVRFCFFLYSPPPLPPSRSFRGQDVVEDARWPFTCLMAY
jgi:hypothetical protein